MKAISFIDEPSVTRRIPEHLNLWEDPRPPPQRNTGRGLVSPPEVSEGTMNPVAVNAAITMRNISRADLLIRVRIDIINPSQFVSMTDQYLK